jgi:carboxylesterase type B
MITHEIKIQTGTVSGVESEGVLSFKGIPYAAPLTGLNRWLPPQPPLTFEGVLDASDYGQICPQDVSMPPLKLFPKAARIFLKTTSENTGWEQGENCLNLNIWTSSVNPADKRPVMVFIHGGGLSMGSSVSPFYDGAALAKKGVVFVTLNYRIGTMGFLAGDGLFEGDALNGNRGFMDQAAALAWVQENIAQFGGDPHNVTVLGHSGGGTSVWALLASPQTEGLIHKAIVLSGPVNMISIEDQLKLTREVLKQLEIPAGDVDALAAIPNEEITGMIMQKTLMKKGKSFGEMSLTKLPTTGAYGTEFLPEDILPALANGIANHIDIMVGSCRHDGRASSIANPLPKTKSIKMMNKFVGGMIAPTKAGRKEILEKYKAIMPDDSSYIINEQIQTDALYRMRALKAAALHSRTSDSKTYVYQFNWESPVADGKLGAIHGLEIPFVFDNLNLSSELIGDMSDIESAQPLATAMSDAWVAFAQNGNPASDILPDWPEYNEETRKTMFFDTDCNIVSDPDSEMRKIWED